MQIYFTRHGESTANIQHEFSNRGLKHGLTPSGREQAVALAHRLEDRSIVRIFSSPLLRAIETTITIAHHLGVEYEISDALREYDCGILEGRSDEAAVEIWRSHIEAWSVHHQWDARVEGGESLNDVRARFIPFVETLTAGDGWEGDVVCVAHGGIYKMMLPLVLANVAAEQADRYGIDYAACIVTETRETGLICTEWNGHSILDQSKSKDPDGEEAV